MSRGRDRNRDDGTQGDHHTGIRERVDPLRLYMYGMQVPGAFLVAFAYTTSIVYYVQAGHLNPLQLVLLGTTVEVTYFITQLPTGILADTIGRRPCVVAGWLLIGMGFVLQGLSPTFAAFVVSEVLIGLGAAFQDGAQEAWIADELDDDAMGPVYLRATQLGTVGSMVGAVLSGVAADELLQLPLLLSGLIICAVGVVLAFLMPERRVEERGEKPARVMEIDAASPGLWPQFTAQFRDARTAVLAVPGLALLLGAALFVGLWSESFDRLWGDFLLKEIGLPHVLGLRPAAWFSAIAVAVALLSLGSTEIAKRRIDRLGHPAAAGMLLGTTVLIGLGVLAMASSHGFALAVGAYLFVQVLRPVYTPLIAGWIAGRVEPRLRATALSAPGLFDSGGQIIGGPAVGWIGVLGTVRTALFAGAVALAPAIALLVAASRRVRALTGMAPAPGAAES